MLQNIYDLANDLKECENQTEKFQYFIELAKEIPELNKLSIEEKNEENKILGCASDAWVIVERDNAEKKIIIRADADGSISKGFLAFFIIGFADATQQEILEFSVNDLQKLGVVDSLSPSRANGALSSLNKIHALIKKL
jgi:cysteine desulfuration protein SufE